MENEMDQDRKRLKRSALVDQGTTKDPRNLDHISTLNSLYSEEAHRFFDDSSSLVSVPCPACGGSGKEDSFSKNGFFYQRCMECFTVYVSPRPNESSLTRYKAESKAWKYRIECLSENLANDRKVTIGFSLFNMVTRTLDILPSRNGASFCDFYTDSDVLLSHLFEEQLFTSLYSLCTSPFVPSHPAVNRINSVEQIPEGVNVIGLTEKLEHAFSPYELLCLVHDSLPQDGLCVFSTWLSTGFEFLVLGSQTPYVIPPEYFNLFSEKGLRRLLDRSGFDLIELSTPWQFDMRFVLNFIGSNQQVRVPEFVRYLLEETDPIVQEDFQTFLQKSRLGSFCQGIIVKR